MHRSTFLRLLSATAVSAFTMRGQWIFAAPLPFIGAPSGLRPYLHLPRPDSIWVSWWSDADSQTYVDFGTSESDLATTVTGSRDVFASHYVYHSAKLSDLQPNTYYYYRVRTESTSSAVFRFRTAKALGSKDHDFKALIIGDNQIVEKESAGDTLHRYEKLMERAVTKIRALHGNKPIEEIIDVIVMPGDQVDYGNNQQWRHLHFYCARIVSAHVAIMTTVGNHETYGDSGLDRYRRLFRYEEVDYGGIAGPDGDTYYSHQMSNVVFVHTNSEIGSNATQTQWVRDITNQVKTDSKVDWVVSICHRPYQAEQYLGDISSWLRNTAVPILNESEKHFLNIGAHHHIYHRGQVRDHPNYHIISGGSAWDQYWGQSGREADYDDVQKSINQWAWQLLEIDQAAEKAEVVCYGEANCRLPADQRWIYNSREIDRFHRIKGKEGPLQPTVINNFDTPQTQPVTIRSSAYRSDTDELLNSVHYQISSTNAFTDFEIDEIVDYENYYGDTGAPDYTPVDIHAGRNILEYHLTENRLSNGEYYLRIRHRDRNATWSAWSPVESVEITGSASSSPRISMASQVVSAGADVSVQYTHGPGNAKDWIGIYKPGDTPGGPASTIWVYVNGPAGTAVLANSGKLEAGREYFAAFFENDGYTEMAPRISFYHGNRPVLALAQNTYDEGDSVEVDYSNVDQSGNRIQLFRAGSVPGRDQPVQNQVLSDASGTWNLIGLEKGYYFAVVMSSSGSIEISERVSFQLGERIASLSLAKSHFPHGDDITATFANGPAHPKDWLGIYRKGDDPGTGELILYHYVDGRAGGNATIVEDVPVGDYFMALFTNDSYTEVSNRVEFSVSPKNFKLDAFNYDGQSGEARMVWKTQSHVNYTLQKSYDLKTWKDVDTYPGNGGNVDITTMVSEQDTRSFFRIVMSD
ncbi:fibronectin type III domain-containing protein [Oceaniferula marina]|uniref:fibronectin type III domain-containing protein n=1 Tax=Oceaniferula marina TaxID=2748318 RepID=UPI001D057EAD|nr:fibronectin type III domain-containing protein [Oceaniferula marina]